ncbi:MAG: isoleucine--tRNA ligase, partial [Candidatus Njordarchaeota archaeon]
MKNEEKQKMYGQWIEDGIDKFWRENNIPKKMFEKRSKGQKFYFLDGPPYTSGYIHLGTAWNKVLKDVIIKYLTMKGFCVRAQPGWDMHGLPIEVLTEKRLNFRTKKDIEKYGIDRFIEDCKKLALGNLKIMEGQFKRLGVFMDWENPYRTIDAYYIESEWYTFKKAWEKGLLYKDTRVVHWCRRCETALAEHEIEYKEIEDPSIYVKFKIIGKENTYLLIWTTTPWTLPANLAALAHPDYEYVKIKVEIDGREEYYWLLKDRLREVMSEIGISKYEIVERVKGSELEGIKYEHPLLDEIPIQKEFDRQYKNAHTVVLGPFVRTTEGTGFVHIAPGHGQEDWQIGKKYGLPIYCPVGEDGTFIEGHWKGIFVKDADKQIIETLRNKGALLYSGKIVHRYPTCWRCKSPLLFRATEQWFLAVSKIKDRIIACDKRDVEWVPSWVRKRYHDGVENVGDWVISRQRFWNTPIPIWICENCGTMEVVGTFDELKKKAKSSLPEDINPHRPFIDNVVLRCPKCGGDMRRVRDVLDVWFDSAICAWASLGYPRRKEKFDELFPADLIIEGQDQVLKWFYAQQVLGVVLFDKVPYKKVVMHGFVLDAAGSKMSKSLGNIVMPEDVISKYGADTLRCYLITIVSPWEDIRFKWDDVKEIYSALNILWNVHIMAKTYMELDNFDPGKFDDKFFEKHARIEDKWILSRINSTIKTVEDNLDKCHFAKAGREILEFIVEDLSRWYGKIIRWRLWIEKDDPVKTVAYYTLYKVFKKLIPVFALFAPFISEKIYQNLIRDLDKTLPISVFLLNWPKADYIDKKLEEMMEVAKDITSAVGAARSKAKIKARWPIREVIVESEKTIVGEAIRNLRDILLRT